MRPEIRIQWLCTVDRPAVLAIEAATDDPWDATRLERAVRARNQAGMVATIDGLVVGHMVYRSYWDGFELLRLAVCPMARRRGVGTALVRKMAAKLGSDKPLLTCAIRESRIDVARLLASLGMSSRLVRDAYQEPREDGIRFAYRLPSATFAELYDGAAVEPFH